MENKILCLNDNNMIHIYNLNYSKKDLKEYINQVNKLYSYTYTTTKPVYMIHNDKIYYDYEKNTENAISYRLRGNVVDLELERKSCIAESITKIFMHKKYIDLTEIKNIYNYLNNGDSRYFLKEETDLDIKLNKKEKNITTNELDILLDKLFELMNITYVGSFNINEVKNNNKYLNYIKYGLLNCNINLINENNKKIKTK